MCYSNFFLPIFLVILWICPTNCSPNSGEAKENGFHQQGTENIHSKFEKFSVENPELKSIENGKFAVETSKNVKISENPEKSEEEEDMQILVSKMMDLAHKFGFVMRTKNSPQRSDEAEVAPFALFPSPVPRRMFEEARAVQQPLNLLYFRLAYEYDQDFLMRALGEAAKVDGTLRKLLPIVEEVHKEGYRQPLTLLLNRADYMIHVNDETDDTDRKYELKQIEVNIGAAGGYIAESLTSMHRQALKISGHKQWASDTVLPDNRVYDTMARGLHLAWQKFGNPKAIMLMVVHQQGPGIPVNRELEDRLDELSEGKMKIVEQTLPECIEKLKLADDFSLMLGNHVVAVVNYRLARTIHPKYITDAKLNTWRMIERSTAIKSPSLALDLASTKKVQQLLARPDELERFFSDPKDAKKVIALRNTYAGLWGVDETNARDKPIIEDAYINPEHYVLKPNRDGGGNNFWDEDIPKMLDKFNGDKRHGFILMQRLRPLVTQNYLIKPHSTETRKEDVTTELSIYGYLLGNQTDGTVVDNVMGGHMMRTKPAGVKEGGTSRGTAFYDTPYLF